nr:hypothetical protein [Tanacetum cinerariifolium]
AILICLASVNATLDSTSNPFVFGTDADCLLLPDWVTLAGVLSLVPLATGADLDLERVTVYDDFGESWITHVIVLLRVLVVHLIYQVFPQ